MSAEDQIRETVTSNDVVLFMKGTATMPQCGFSSQIAGILNYMGVEYKDVDVLADDAVRQSIKEYRIGRQYRSYMSKVSLLAAVTSYGT